MKYCKVYEAANLVLNNDDEKRIHNDRIVNGSSGDRRTSCYFC